MTEALHKVQVGRRLRAAIEALGLSQIDVAKAFGTAPSKLGNWLRGDNYPSVWFVKRFCDRHGITTDWLYRGIVSGIPSKDLADALWKSEQEALTEAAAPPIRPSPKERPTRRAVACVIPAPRLRGG